MTHIPVIRLLWNTLYALYLFARGITDELVIIWGVLDSVYLAC